MPSLARWLLYPAILVQYVATSAIDNGEWETSLGDEVGADGPCNIERHDAATFTQKEFELRYAEKEPVIVTGIGGSAEFRRLCRRSVMLDKWGERVVTLASANAYSYNKVDMKLSRYINEYVRPQKAEVRGNDTLYLFGDIDREEWDDLLRHYERPPWAPKGHTSELSFGMAGAGTGVPFHIHGPGWAEVVYGRKRWFLTAPKKRPVYDPDETTLLWFRDKYPRLTRLEKPLECVLGPGEMIYFPNMWWHATLNVETSVFISTFLSP